MTTDKPGQGEGQPYEPPLPQDYYQSASGRPRAEDVFWQQVLERKNRAERTQLADAELKMTWGDEVPLPMQTIDAIVADVMRRTSQESSGTP